MYMKRERLQTRIQVTTVCELSLEWKCIPSDFWMKEKFVYWSLFVKEMRGDWKQKCIEWTGSSKESHDVMVKNQDKKKKKCRWLVVCLEYAWSWRNVFKAIVKHFLGSNAQTEKNGEDRRRTKMYSRGIFVFLYFFFECPSLLALEAGGGGRGVTTKLLKYGILLSWLITDFFSTFQN